MLDNRRTAMTQAPLAKKTKQLPLMYMQHLLVTGPVPPTYQASSNYFKWYRSNVSHNILLQKLTKGDNKDNKAVRVAILAHKTPT